MQPTGPSWSPVPSSKDEIISRHRESPPPPPAQEDTLRQLAFYQEQHRKLMEEMVTLRARVTLLLMKNVELESEIAKLKSAK